VGSAEDTMLAAVPELDALSARPNAATDTDDGSATSTLQLALAGSGDGNATPRVASDLSVLQEEALIGLIYEQFVVENDCKSMDYDKVKRFALTIQMDEEVCATLCTAPVPTEAECWIPEDDWLTDMCKAFKKSYEEHVAMTERQSTGSPPELTARSKAVAKVKAKGPKVEPKLSSRSPSGKISNRPRSASPKPAAKARPGSARGTKGSDSPKSARSPSSRAPLVPVE